MPGFSLSGKVALVTGGSQGIGKYIALAMGRKGAKVVICGRSEERLARGTGWLQSHGIETYPLVADITRKDDCDRMVESVINTYGRLDVVVNNAGTSMRGNFQDVDVEVFKKIMDVNFLGSVNTTKAALAQVLENKGSIVFISSLAGIRGLPYFSAYSAAKMSMTALAESLKVELAGTGVHIGIVYVGFTEIEDEKKVLDASGQLITLKSRSDRGAQSLEVVSSSVVNLIEKRKFIKVLTLIGKLNYLTNKLIPRLIDRVFILGKKKWMEGME